LGVMILLFILGSNSDGVGPERVFGGKEEWGGVRSGTEAAWTILLFISLVLGPLNRLVWYVPSLMYTSGLG